MKKFLISLYVFLKLYRMGYSWSGLYNSHWGFYRLNYEKNSEKEFAILDIDFNSGNEPGAEGIAHTFSVIHGGVGNKVLFRVDDNKITEHSHTIP